MQILSNPSDLERYCKIPPYFLVAFTSQLKLITSVERIKDFLAQKEYDVNEVNRVLDAVFVLDRGWVINFGDGQGGFKFITPEEKSAEGWIARDSGTVLFENLG